MSSALWGAKNKTKIIDELASSSYTCVPVGIMKARGLDLAVCASSKKRGSRSMRGVAFRFSPTDGNSCGAEVSSFIDARAHFPERKSMLSAVMQGIYQVCFSERYSTIIRVISRAWL